MTTSSFVYLSTRFAQKTFIYSLMIASFLHGISAYADILEQFTNKQANNALRSTLNTAAKIAVEKLGKEDAFFANETFKIPLPDGLEKTASFARMVGQGDKYDNLVLSMNRAAESAVPLAMPLLINAIKSMSITDAKNILTGGDNAVTDYFKAKTENSLMQKFEPIVAKITAKSGLAKTYNTIAGQLLKGKDESNVNTYVSRKAVNSLFSVIGSEEKSIRDNPVQYGNKILTDVFSAIGKGSE